MTCLVHEIIEDPDCPLCLDTDVRPEDDVQEFVDRMLTLTSA